MPSSPDTTELCRSGQHRIEELFDMAVLFWPGGELIVGDHCYTDPQCAVINTEMGWCVSGGQGLEICLFENGLPEGPLERNAPDPEGLKRMGLWRDHNPPPDGQRYWWITNIWLFDKDLIRVLVNPLGPGAGLYEVDVRTLRAGSGFKSRMKKPGSYRQRFYLTARGRNALIDPEALVALQKTRSTHAVRLSLCGGTPGHDLHTDFSLTLTIWNCY